MSRRDDQGTKAIQARKREHLRVAAGDVEARRSAGWNEIDFVHQALPELDLEDIDLNVSFLGRKLHAPLMIAGMTGGHDDAREINARLARAAQKFGLAMGVGSQRAALRSSEVAHTYEIARKEAPDGFLIANMGAAQLVAQGAEDAHTLEDAQAAIDMIRADALAVHLNFLEEAVQPEGDHRAAGCLDAIAALADALETPLVAKETGAGMSATVAAELADAGVAALDVGGRGGTSFAAVEGRRAAKRGDAALARLGDVFHDWGIPTAVSIVAASRVGLPVIGTGGIRSGLDAARGLALGATLVGVARPALHAALEGDEALERLLEQLLLELKTAMFLTRSGNVEALRQASIVIHGETCRWLAELDLELLSR